MDISKCETCMEECPQAQGRHEAAVGRMYAMHELAKCAPYWDALFDENEKPKITPDRLRELVQADREGRCVVLPSEGYTDKDGENALKSAMNTCFYHNNPVTRYIADAVAEKLTREAAEAALKGEQDG